MAKHPMKIAKKEFPRHGAILLSETHNQQIWQAPWGGRLNIGDRTHLANVRELVAAMQKHVDPLKRYVRCPPRAFKNPEITKHFTERLLLMSQQGNVTEDEVFKACVSPQETRYSSAARTYAFMRGDIAVVVAERDGRSRLVTLLWTKADLWEKNPRVDLMLAGSADA